MLRYIDYILFLVGISQCAHLFVPNNGTGDACLIVDGNFTFDLNFIIQNETKSFSTGIEKVLDFGGNCHDIYNNQSAQTLEVKFLPEGTNALNTKQWELKLIFVSTSTESFKLVNYTLETQQTDQIPVFGRFVAKENDDVTATGISAYKCTSSKLALDKDSMIKIENSKIIAFANMNGTEFPSNQVYEVCRMDSKTKTVVPIVVGSCLGALVIVVLVAYLIGRARAKRQGYASV